MPSRRGCTSKLAKALWCAMTAQKHGVDLSSPKGAGNGPHEPLPEAFPRVPVLAGDEFENVYIT
eukprot:9041236-Pyramimonas_sp.AAC.1